VADVGHANGRGRRVHLACKCPQQFRIDEQEPSTILMPAVSNSTLTRIHPATDGDFARVRGCRTCADARRLAACRVQTRVLAVD
jgi:hypothetical protein